MWGAFLQASQSASLSGACAPADAGNPFSCSDYAPPNDVPFQDCKQVFFRAQNLGTCHLALDFANGFAYSADVTITQAPGDQCCHGMFEATPPQLVVTEPDASCADAGDAD